MIAISPILLSPNSNNAPVTQEVYKNDSSHGIIKKGNFNFFLTILTTFLAILSYISLFRLFSCNSEEIICNI